jgi:DNA-directed RNA polymerase subunit H (RpoH/RPB5)
LNQRVQELEQDIREAFWVDDEARIERDHYERLLRENGIDPWEIPGTGTET